jgi:peptidoglycan/xylan/chitin deacetylase (PgdA/CDA1 family)
VNVAERIAGAAARVVFPTPDPAHRSLILCYHSVHRTAPYLSVTPAEFERHLDWLAAHCRIVPLDRIREPADGDGPCVAITFDDGFVDNYTEAFPRLHEHGLAATFFVTVGFVERDPDVMARMARLWLTDVADVEPLQWGQVAEMQAAGMRFGSHTISHPNLADLARAEVKDELQESKARLEDRLQQSVTDLAYPFGKPRHHVVAPTVECARAARYDRAVITSPRAVARADDPLSLPRLVIGNDDIAHLSAKVMGDIDWHAHVRERLPRALSERSLSRR